MSDALRTIPESRIVELASRFIAWPSEQTELMEADPAVRGFVERCVRPLIDAHGLQSSIDPAGNLHVLAGPEGAPLELAVVTYAMTHPRSTMENPFSAEIIKHDGVSSIRGRGVSEQKGAMAAALAAFLDVAADKQLASRIAFVVLTAGETGRHDAIAQALAAMPEAPHCAILAVGTNGQISLGNRGRLDIEVTIRGKAAHSSTPWAGRDVTVGVAAVLQAAQRLSSTLGAGGELGPATLTCTAIRTWPEATHTVQSEARMVFDRRLLAEEDADRVFEEIAAVFRASCDLDVDVMRGPFMHGCAIDRGSAFIQFVEQALARSGRTPPLYYYARMSLDAGYLAKNGVPAVMWGPGDPEQFHTVDESVRVEQLVAAARAYRLVFAAAAGGPA